jgi:hypothetical protein
MPRDSTAPSRQVRLVGAMNRRLVDELSAAGQRRRITAGGVAIYLLATAVHAVTLLLLGAGAWLLVAGDGWPPRVLGCFCLTIVLVLLPTIARARDRHIDVTDSAPETMALIAEIAGVVRSPVPRRVLIADTFGAWVSVRPLRGFDLTLGAPLWVACSAQARVALLAHELGHLAHRDLIHGRYVAAAADSLIAWHDIFSPRSLHDQVLRDNGIIAPSGTFGAYVILWPVRAVLIGYLKLMELANAAAKRRREHYADLAAVRAAGTHGAVDVLETALAHAGLVLTANRVAVTPGRPPLRPALLEYMAGYGPARRAHARSEGDLKDAGMGASHPPTVERLRLVESVERAHPAVVLDVDRNARVDDELEGALTRALASYADGFRGW